MSTAKFSQNTVLILASSLLLFAPLVRGGKTSTALMTMELIGLLILVIIFWFGLYKEKAGRPVWYFVLGSLGIIAAYLIPLPDSVWSQLPGRSVYIETAHWLEANSELHVYKSLSLVPQHTVAFMFTCIPALALFLSARSLSTSRQILLINAFLLTALLQALLGMIQHFTLSPFWHFGVISLAPQGTYLNQNHLTAFMEMAEPIALALMMYALIRPGLSAWRRFLEASAYALLSLALTFIPLISSSRTGIALLFLSIFLSFWVMTTPGMRKKVAAPVIILRLALLILAVLVQLQTIRSVSNVVAKMEPTKVTGDLRWELWNTGMRMAQDFAPFGSGISTLQQVYRTYQSDTLTQFVNHLHNDYLQLVVELGVFGIVIIVAFLFLYVRQWFLLRHEDDEFQRLLQSGAGVGILLFLLYSITEFNLHTPANVLFMAFLCGVFFVPVRST